MYDLHLILVLSLNIFSIYIPLNLFYIIIVLAADCSDLLKINSSLPTGVYEVTTWNTSTKARVYCDMDTEGGGWTVLCLLLSHCCHQQFFQDLVNILQYYMELHEH